MQWLLIMVLVSPTHDIEFEPLPYASEAECHAAGEAVVEAHPAFEWREASNSPTAEQPADSSYVMCIPAAGRQ